MRRVLVNMANLRTGGALQVAASFLDELVALRDDPIAVDHPWLRGGLEVAASPEVVDNCSRDVARELPLTVRSGTVDLAAMVRRRYDVAFTMFGPEYVPTNARRRVVGFADVTSLYPEFQPNPTARQVARRRAARMSFRAGGHLVVEAPLIARDLEHRWQIPAHRITVVPNTYNAVFDQPQMWQPVEVPSEPGVANVCYVTRAYPHKNLAVLGAVGDELQARGVAARFVLTLTADEWAGLPESARRHSVNVGPVSVPQLPNLYAACQASIFPSLLEAFSATPLEALVTGTPLAAARRPFVRDACGDVPWYADPEDPAALAEALALALRAPQDRVARGVEMVRARADANARARAYVDIIGQ